MAPKVRWYTIARAARMGNTTGPIFFLVEGTQRLVGTCDIASDVYTDKFRMRTA